MKIGWLPIIHWSLGGSGGTCPLAVQSGFGNSMQAKKVALYLMVMGWWTGAELGKRTPSLANSFNERISQGLPSLAGIGLNKKISIESWIIREFERAPEVTNEHQVVHPKTSSLPFPTSRLAGGRFPRDQRNAARCPDRDKRNYVVDLNNE